MKVTLNSLRMLAWLLSRLRHACSGGAPPSKSNCSESNKFPTPEAVTSDHPAIGKRETKQIRRERRRTAGAKGGRAHQLQRGPADVLLRRPRVLPAVEDVAAHHRARPLARSPRNATCRFSLPRVPPAVTAAAPPTRSGYGQSRRFAGRTPSSYTSPAATVIPGGGPPHGPARPPQIDSAGALGIGWWSRRGRARERRGGRRAGWIGPNPIALPCSSSSSTFLFSSRAGCRRAGALWSRSRRAEKVRRSRRRTHWWPGGRDGAPALLEEKKKVVTGCTALPTGHARMNGGYRYYSSSPLGWVAVPIPLRAVC